MSEKYKKNVKIFEYNLVNNSFKVVIFAKMKDKNDE